MASLECILQLALQGAGIARLGDYMAAGPIRTRKLVPLLVDQQHPELRKMGTFRGS